MSDLLDASKKGTQNKRKNHWGFFLIAGLSIIGLFLLTVALLVFYFSNNLITFTANPSAYLSGILLSGNVTPTFFYTNTPFQPLPTNTLTVTSTVTATQTPTSTHKPTLTATPTSTPLLTVTPEVEMIVPTMENTSPEASVGYLEGHPQSFTLDCEATSAVDWAAFFGYSISESEFLNSLPSSDDPEQGFVGSYMDATGQLPPNSYGVHAPPVAALLRAYGVPANERRGMSWEELQAEIIAGRPVITWVIYLTSYGYPVTYTSSSGNATIVARNEHTVIVTGFTQNQVSILDGSWHYTRPISQFLSSWEVLGNMAIVYGSNE